MKNTIRRNGNPSLDDFSKLLDDIHHYVEYSENTTYNVRVRYAPLFLSLPEDYRPMIRPVTWMNHAIAWFYMTYMNDHCHSAWDPMEVVKLPVILYQHIMNYCGYRSRAERTLLDMLTTAKQLVDNGNARSLMFLRFLGLIDPLPTHAVRYYLFCLSSIAKIGATHLFPEAETSDGQVAGIPLAVCTGAADLVLKRFCEGRMLKFYTERIEKTANIGFLRFGGRAIAELDVILEYLLRAYLDASHTIEEQVGDIFRKFPEPYIDSFTRVAQICAGLKVKPSNDLLSEIMERCMREKGQFPITLDVLLKYMAEYGLTVPFIVTEVDFTLESQSENLIPLVTEEFEFHQAEFDKVTADLQERKDDIQTKQLRSARVKFEQALSGRSTVRIFETNVREFFEKLELIRISLATL
jgi:hypothetical protein